MAKYAEGTGLWWEKRKVRDLLGDIRVDGRRMLKWV
jgi:hypothetical protein